MVDYYDDCGLWDDAGSWRCSFLDFRVCLKPEFDEKPQVPDTEAVRTSTESCPVSYREIEQCRCNSAYCKPTLVCLHDDIVDYEVNGIYSACSPGFHSVESFYCSFFSFRVCVPD